MKKHNFIITYKKNKGIKGFRLLIKTRKTTTPFWMETKLDCLYFKKIATLIYNQGRYDEFKDNNNKTDTLMERFGI